MKKKKEMKEVRVVDFLNLGAERENNWRKGI